MQLRAVELTNIRSYRSARLELRPGTTLITGDVGAGKTSLLYAIEMALFGFAEVEGTYLIRHGAPRADVRVTLEDGETTYEIRREFRRVHRHGRDSFEPERSSFSHRGSTTSYSATEIRQRVIDLLRFPDEPNPRARSEVWRWAVYVPQERMREVLAQAPEDRLETVRRALGVERYRRAAENAKLLARELDRSAENARATAKGFDHFEAELAKAESEAPRLLAEAGQLSEAWARVLADAEAAERERQRAEEALRVAETDRRSLSLALEEQQREAAALRKESARRDGLRREIAALPVSSVPSAEASAREAEERWKALDEERLRAAQGEAALQPRLVDLAERKARRRAAEERVGERRERSLATARELAEAREEWERSIRSGPLEPPLEPTPRALAEIDRELEGTRSAEQSARLEAARAGHELEEWSSLLEAGTCPRCHQPVVKESFEGHRTEAEGAERIARDEAGRLEARRIELERERRARERYEQAMLLYRGLYETRGAARRRLDEAEAQEADASRLLRATEAELREHEQGLAGAQELETEARRSRESLDRFEAEVAAARTARDRLAAEAARVREAKQRRELLERELATAERTIVETKVRCDERERSLEARRASAGEVAARKAALEAAEARANRVRDQREELVRRRESNAGRSHEVDRQRASSLEGLGQREALRAGARGMEAKGAWVRGPFREALLNIETRLLASARQQFEREFSRAFATLIDDPSLLAEVDATFTPRVRFGEDSSPAEALSGGERTALALAFRLALSRVVRTLGQLSLETLLLDEPTDGFSPEQVGRMGELLASLSLPQLVIVSHEPGLAGLADRVFTVRKVDGRSTIELDGAPPGPQGPVLAGPAAEGPARAGVRALPR